MESLKQLYELQELDWARAEKRNALAEVRDALAGDPQLTAAQRRMQQIEAQHSERNAQWQSAQLAAQRLEEQLKNVENRLYGGAVTNVRELEAFQEEQAALQNRISAAEDTLLEHMIATEELQDALEDAQRTFAALQERRRELLPQLQRQEQTLAAELDALDLERDDLLPPIPPRTLALYESLLDTRGGHAVSKVDAGRGICGACRIALPRSDMQRVRNSEGIVQCNNCRRILYLE